MVNKHFLLDANNLITGKANKLICVDLIGFFISAPFSHFMLLLLQKAFAGKTSARAKVAMIVTSNGKSIYDNYSSFRIYFFV